MAGECGTMKCCDFDLHPFPNSSSSVVGALGPPQTTAMAALMKSHCSALDSRAIGPWTVHSPGLL